VGFFLPVPPLVHDHDGSGPSAYAYRGGEHVAIPRSFPRFSKLTGRSAALLSATSRCGFSRSASLLTLSSEVLKATAACGAREGMGVWARDCRFDPAPFLLRYDSEPRFHSTTPDPLAGIFAPGARKRDAERPTFASIATAALSTVCRPVRFFFVLQWVFKAPLFDRSKLRPCIAKIFFFFLSSPFFPLPFFPVAAAKGLPCTSEFEALKRHCFPIRRFPPRSAPV